MLGIFIELYFRWLELLKRFSVIWWLFSFLAFKNESDENLFIHLHGSRRFWKNFKFHFMRHATWNNAKCFRRNCTPRRFIHKEFLAHNKAKTNSVHKKREINWVIVSKQYTPKTHRRRTKEFSFLSRILSLDHFLRFLFFVKRPRWSKRKEKVVKKQLIISQYQELIASRVIIGMVNRSSIISSSENSVTFTDICGHTACTTYCFVSVVTVNRANVLVFLYLIGIHLRHRQVVNSHSSLTSMWGWTTL